MNVNQRMLTMKKLLLAAVLTALTSTAFAEGFEGLDISAGVSDQHINFGGGSQTNNGGSFEVFNDVGKTNVNGNFNFGYNLKYQDKFILGVQASLQPISSDTAYVQKTPGTVSSNKLDSRYDLSFLPGYLITPETLVYGKIGYSYAKRDIANVNGAWSSSLNYNGYVVGLGLKSFELGELVNLHHLYGFAEINYADYGKQIYSVVNTSGASVVSSSLKMDMTTGIVGIGFVF